MSLFGKFKQAAGQKTNLDIPRSAEASFPEPEKPMGVMDSPSAFGAVLRGKPLTSPSTQLTSSAYLPPFLRLRDHSGTLPFKYSMALSGAFHLISPGALFLFWTLLVFLLAILFNIDLDLARFFPKPEPQVQDMEFVLAPNRDAKTPENAKFLGEFNQEAGGKPDESQPQPFEDSEKAAAREKAAPQSQVNRSPAPSPKPTPQMNPSPQQKPVKPQPKQPPKPQAKVPPLPTHKVAIATPQTPTFQPRVPTPKPSQDIPKRSSNPSPIIQRTTGPRTPASKASRELASISQSGLASASRGAAAAGSAKKPGVAVRQANYGPYMAEIKRRMSRNWRPPRGDRDKRVELKFEIHRDGSLGTIEVAHSSGETLADEAAVNAVKISAPFKTLPPFHQGETVQILFTFDYNVLGGTY